MVEIKGGKLSAIPDADLREAFVGAFEGIAPENKRFLGGESIGELMDRIHPAVDKLRQQPQWDTVLLVLHGGVNRAILSYALTGQRLFMGNLAQTAGCINALDVGEAQHDWVVRLMNFSPPSHLQPFRTIPRGLCRGWRLSSRLGVRHRCCKPSHGHRHG